MDTEKTGSKQSNVKPSCEKTGVHVEDWIAAEDGMQIWVCTQCGKPIFEYDDSQP